MKEQVDASPRTPTSSWSGYGFSKSLPGFMLRQQKMQHAQLAQVRTTALCFVFLLHQIFIANPAEVFVYFLLPIEFKETYIIVREKMDEGSVLEVTSFLIVYRTLQLNS